MELSVLRRCIYQEVIWTNLKLKLGYILREHLIGEIEFGRLGKVSLRTEIERNIYLNI